MIFSFCPPQLWPWKLTPVRNPFPRILWSPVRCLGVYSLPNCIQTTSQNDNKMESVFLVKVGSKRRSRKRPCQNTTSEPWLADLWPQWSFWVSIVLQCMLTMLVSNNARCLENLSRVEHQKTRMFWTSKAPKLVMELTNRQHDTYYELTIVNSSSPHRKPLER